MRLLRYGPVGSERPAVQVEDGRTFDLTSLTDDIDGAFLAGDGLERVRVALASGTLAALDIDGERIGSPIARPPAVLCIGMNYAAHAAESGSEPPSTPVLFHKHPGTVVGPDDDVVLPAGSTHSDWEVELGVVLEGTPNRLGTVDEAMDYVAGYVLANDLSERYSQIDVSGGQWSKGKSAPTFCPTGPYLVPADEVDPQDVALKSWVNAEVRQDSSTTDMVFTVAEIIHHLSHHVLMLPGDLILTGTPEGVALSGRFPYLEVGDVMELEASGLGRQRQVVVPA